MEKNNLADMESVIELLEEGMEKLKEFKTIIGTRSLNNAYFGIQRSLFELTDFYNKICKKNSEKYLNQSK